VTGVDGPVNAMALQANGMVLIGGSFNFVNGVFRQYFAQLLGSAATFLDSPLTAASHQFQAAVTGEAHPV
jgi:hypothetical protein